MFTVNHLTSAQLPDISFTAQAGDCLCIFGESGTGKTLLLRALADLDINQGDLCIDQEKREQVSADQWRQLVTYLPTDSHWWSTLVKHHFTFSEHEVKQLALDPAIGQWEIARLSSGEKQRLALLRALAHRPKVLLLDEVTANLDAENTQKVEALLKDKMQSGLILIWVTHDVDQRQRMATHSYHLSKTNFKKV